MTNVYSAKGVNQIRQSRLLFEMKRNRWKSRSTLSPEQKMLAAFSLSLEVRKLRIAGLKNQGFSETEILQILKAGRK